MKKLVMKYLIYTAAVGIGLSFLPGAELEDYSMIFIFALVFYLLNLILLPILLVLTLPLNMITFGLASSLAYGLMILLTDAMLKQVDIGGFLNAVLVGLIIIVLKECYRVVTDKQREKR